MPRALARTRLSHMTKSDLLSNGPIQVGVHETKTNLSKLLRMVESGAEVQILRGHVPVARLVPMEQPRRKRVLGSLKGQIRLNDDWADMDAEIAADFENSEIFPPETS